MIWVLRAIAAAAGVVLFLRVLQVRLRDALEPLGQTPHNRTQQ